MQLSDFDYVLPKELIAQYPHEERDLARLMVLNRTGATIGHSVFRNITDYLRKGDLLVLNDTKVVPARLLGSRLTGGRVEILLLNRKAQQSPLEKNSSTGFTFKALIRSNRIKLGEKIIFENPTLPCGELQGYYSAQSGVAAMHAELTAKNEVTFYAKSLEDIYSYGVLPLPPYIKRAPRESDNTYYQTVYARNDGSVAAPTAGLHFTRELILELESFGINVAYVTLHVGYATFKPVKCEDIAKHKMEHEYFKIPQHTLEVIESTRSSGGRIVAVGTTVLRSLETYALGNKEGDTNLFIYPGYKFKLVDCILTNFHLPKTTLFMLVCAFAEKNFIKEAYQEAIDKKYRFYSYGDAMLII